MSKFVQVDWPTVAFVVAMVSIMALTIGNIVNRPAMPLTCYKGHEYRVDSQGVMYPTQSKFGVVQCKEDSNAPK